MIALFRTLLLCCFAASTLASCAAEEERGPVVLAAASLQGALEEVADDWAARGHARPVLSYAGTPSLARQIQGGAPADLFISADAQWMDWAQERDLITPETRRDLLSNALVFIAHKDDTDCGTGPCSADNARLAIADPDAVPAGRYAKAAMQADGSWSEWADRIVPTENVRAALALVENEQARYAVVYASDALASDRVDVAYQLHMPEGQSITYPAALLTGAANAEAWEFLDYLASPDAAQIFCAHGFTMPDGRPPC